MRSSLLRKSPDATPTAPLRRLGLLGLLGLALLVLPACANRQARRGAGAPPLDDPLLGVSEPTLPYSAYRPKAAPAPPRRTLSLGGYAGFRYDRASRDARVRGVPAVPTEFGAGAGCATCPPGADPARAARVPGDSSVPGMEPGYGFEAQDPQP